MNIILTILIGFPLGYLIRSRGTAVITYVLVDSYLFTFQTAFLIMQWVDGDDHAFGTRGRDWSAERTTQFVSYLVLNGVHRRRRHRARRPRPQAPRTTDRVRRHGRRRMTRPYRTKESIMSSHGPIDHLQDQPRTRHAILNWLLVLAAGLVLMALVLASALDSPGPSQHPALINRAEPSPPHPLTLSKVTHCMTTSPWTGSAEAAEHHVETVGTTATAAGANLAEHQLELKNLAKTCTAPQ